MGWQQDGGGAVQQMQGTSWEGCRRRVHSIAPIACPASCPRFPPFRLLLELHQQEHAGAHGAAVPRPLVPAHQRRGRRWALPSPAIPAPCNPCAVLHWLGMQPTTSAS